MAIIRVHHAGSNTSPYDTWAKAATLLQTALTAWAVGDVIYVHVGATTPHYETGSINLTLTAAASTLLNPVHIYGVDKDNSDAYVPLPSSNIIEVVAATLTVKLYGVWHGIRLVSTTASLFVKDGYIYDFNDCYLKAGTGSYDDIRMDGQAGTKLFHNCDIVVGDQIVNLYGSAVFKDTRFTIGVSPSILISATYTKRIFFDGCDFSGIAAGNTLLAGVNGTQRFDATFANCDMPTTWTAKSGTFGSYFSSIEFLNCDDSNDYPRTEIYKKAGDVKTDTGVYITTGNWSDETANSTGVPLSQKLTPSSEIHQGGTLDSFTIDAYLDSTGSKTFTVELIDDFETALQDDEVWLEIFYHATSGQVKQSIGTSRVIPGDTVANLSAGTGVANWTGEPASSRSVKLAVTVTTGNIGWYSAVVRLAKYEANGADAAAGAALYVAPLLTVT